METKEENLNLKLGFKDTIDLIRNIIIKPIELNEKTKKPIRHRLTREETSLLKSSILNLENFIQGFSLQFLITHNKKEKENLRAYLMLEKTIKSLNLIKEKAYFYFKRKYALNEPIIQTEKLKGKSLFIFKFQSIEPKDFSIIKNLSNQLKELRKNSKLQTINLENEPYCLEITQAISLISKPKTKFENPKITYEW